MKSSAVIRCLVLLAAFCGLVPPTTAADTDGWVEECDCAGQSCSLTLLWNEVPKTGFSLDQDFFSRNSCGDGFKRLIADTTLEFRVKHFNYLKYEVSVEKEEKVVEAYSVLNTLWGDILGLAGIMGLPDAPRSAKRDELLEALFAWEFAIDELNGQVTASLGKYPASPLTSEQVGEIDQAKAHALDKISGLGKAEKEVRRLAVQDSSASTEFKYRVIGELALKQSAVVSRARAFIHRAQRVVDGGKKTVKGSKAGTVVTLTLTAVERNQASEDKVVAIRYFVTSKFPVEFHLGVGRSDLDDLKFETVRTAQGLDAYDLVKDETDREAFLAFLSVPVWSWEDRQDFGVLVTLGTGLEEPGEDLFAGVSLKLFKRFVISYGQLSQEVSEGRNSFSEQIGTALEARELFAQIDTRRAWGDFWGVSFLVDF